MTSRTNTPLCILTLLCCLIAASDACAAPPEVKTLGGVKLGAAGESAVQIFGKPSDVSSDFQLPQEVAHSGAVTYDLCETAKLVLLVGKIVPFEARILQITVQGAPCDKTAAFEIDGVGLGDNEAAVKAKFGEPDREVNRGQDKLKSVAYNASNVVFNIDQGQVIGISVVYRNNMMAEDLTGERKMTPIDAWSAIGDMRVRARQYELALEAFDKVLEMDPNSVEANVRTGAIWYQGNDMIKAEKHLSKALALDPQNAVATYNLGRVAIRNKKPADARRLLEKAVSLDSSNAAAYNELGLLDENENKLPDAARRFRKAAELAPDASEPRQNLGRVLLRSGDRRAAIDEYSQALVLELKSPLPNQVTVDALRQALKKLRADDESSGEASNS